MARKARIEIEDALYHVITRGNQKQKIFKSQGDFETYLSVHLRERAGVEKEVEQVITALEKGSI